jgi:hypothetical protein
VHILHAIISIGPYISLGLPITQEAEQFAILLSGKKSKTKSWLFLHLTDMLLYDF